ncbi:MAG: DUF5107 domain-containing protein [Phycisphaerae bacterium]
MRRLLPAVLLICSLAGLASAKVTAKEETLELPEWKARQQWQENPSGHRPLYPVKGTQKQVGKRKLKTIVLENEYVKVQVVPELGGVVARAIHKPTGYDYFFWEGKLKNWLPWWESGVKMSFPYYEHGLGTDQPSGYRVVENKDGSITVATWMEFSRFNQAYHRKRYGRFSNMIYTQEVTVEPGGSYFNMTFRVVNPGPWKQGLRLWNDTLYPRNHTKKGTVQSTDQPPEVTKTEWVFPTFYASDHGGGHFGKYDRSRNKISGMKDGWSKSVFAWDIPYGFAGLYYPEVKVNRLRLFDPDEAPGAKQWYIADGRYKPDNPSRHMYNFCELWGGSDSVFEGIENWIGPGEVYDYTHRYTLVAGLEKVDFANEHLAMDIDLQGDEKSVTIAPLRRSGKWLNVLLDGEKIGRAPMNPAKPATFSLSGPGKLQVLEGRTPRFTGDIPIVIPDDKSRHATIRKAFKNKWHAEMRGTADEHGQTYQTAIKNYPEGSTDKGRVLLRDGQITAAVACLNKAAEKDKGEGTYLLGMALLEQGKRAEARKALETAADNGYHAARYYLALMDLADGNTDAARQQVRTLYMTKNREHWQARRLHAYLVALDKKNLEPLQVMAEIAPGDLYTQAAIAKAAGKTGDEQARKAAEQAIEKLSREPGAAKRLKEFLGVLEGKYPIPPRIK